MTTGGRLGRRAFLGLGLGGLLPVLQGTQDSAVARLQQPDLAGRPRDRVTNYENDPFIVGVERRLRCTCGCGLDIYTCRTTDFTCTYSPALHRELVALVEQGKTADEIVAAFVAKYGETALMAPPKQGFNWAGYLLPGIVIVLVGVVLGWVMLRRARKPAPAAPVPAEAAGLTSDDDARLKEELARLES
ncbi:MAG TPA: cytochrome c-type biogenesis protein CcmH [Gemmatimonadales bacterium]|nr:cytochrome c-type biogenesis protein CcmH [Gemmatimonadales bacterium]